VSWLTHWTFKREARRMLWLGLVPVILIALMIVLTGLRGALSSG
jgi:hypothetical protein